MPGSPLLAMALPLLASRGGAFGFLWPQDEYDRWRRVNAIPCRGPGVPNVIGIVPAPGSTS